MTTYTLAPLPYPLVLKGEPWDDSADQTVSRLTQSPEGQRDSQQGIVKMVYQTFHTGGLRPKIQLGVWSRDLDKYGRNEGLQTQIPYTLTLPYLLQVQSQITSGENMSGYRAANHRVHPLNTNLGGSAFRYVVGLGEVFYRDVSTSDHSLEVCATSGITNTDFVGIGAACEWTDSTNTRYYLVGVKNTGTSKKPLYTSTDPTAATVAFTNRGPINAGPGTSSGQYVFGLDYLASLPALIVYGRIDINRNSSNNDGLFYFNDTAANLDQIWVNQVIDANAAAIKVGGFSWGEDPATPNTIGYTTPIGADELATTVSPRRAYKVAFTATPTATLTTINNDLDHTEDSCWYAGGSAHIGDTLSGIATRAVLVDSSNVVRDLNFPGLNGTTVMGAVTIQPAGRVLIVHVAKSDGSDGQDWYFDLSTGAWHASCALLTKADTPGGIAIAFSRKEINKNQRRRYTFTPDGGDTTKTNVYRQFQSRDLFANPLLSNTSELFHYGAIKMWGLNLDAGGPVEADKALMRIVYGNMYASAVAGSYSKIDFSVATDGNIGTFTSVETNTFDTQFESYNIPSYGRPFKTLLPQWSLDNGSTTEGNAEAHTANALPMIEEMVVRWPDLSVLTCTLDLEETVKPYGGVRQFVNYLRSTSLVTNDLSATTVGSAATTVNAKPVYKFMSDDGVYNIPVTVEVRKLRPGTTQSVLILREVRGTT